MRKLRIRKILNWAEESLLKHIFFIKNLFQKNPYKINAYREEIQKKQKEIDKKISKRNKSKKIVVETPTVDFSDKNKAPYKIIFVVGPPRSGTTILNLMIAKEDFIPECTFISRILSQFEEFLWYSDRRYYPYLLNQTNQMEIFKKFIFDFIITAKYFTDQRNNLHKNNYICLKDPYLTKKLDLLAEFFNNNLKIISTMRNPKDVIASMKIVKQKEKKKFNIHQVCKQIIEYYEELRNNLITENEKVFMLVKYEDIIKKDDKVFSNIENFLNIKLDKTGKLSKNKNTIDVNSPFYVDNYDKELNNSSLNKYKEILTKKEILIVEKYFGHIMRLYDYTDSH